MLDRKQELKKNIEELTRRSILNAAMELVQEESLTKVTMDKVADKADFAKGTLYLYFKNKATLLECLVDYCFEPLENNYLEIMNSKEEPLKKIEQCIHATANYVTERKSLLRKLGNYIFRASYTDITNSNSWYWNVIGMFSEIIKESEQQRGAPSSNHEKKASYLLGAINVMMTHLVLIDEEESSEEAAQLCINTFIHGFAAT